MNPFSQKSLSKLVLMSLLIFTPTSFVLSEGDSSPANMCFFELGNKFTSENFFKQFKNEKNCTTDLNKKGPYCFFVGDQENKNSKDAFKEMIKSMQKAGKKCDGLVISGHHTGSWYGTDNTNLLRLSDIEEISCELDNNDWFQNIQALWLDGCNTVTDVLDEKGNPEKAGGREGQHGDSEALRVYWKEHQQVLESLGKNASEEENPLILQELQQAFAGTLSQSTALSSRYLRMFPKTQVYGVNGGIRTGTDRKGRSYIYEHITGAVSALAAEKKHLETLRGMEEGIDEMEKNLKIFFNNCDAEQKRDNWEKIDLEVGDSQAVSHQDFDEVRELGCALIDAKVILDNPDRYSDDLVENTKQAVKDILARINEQSKGADGVNKYFNILFNNIFDTWTVANKYKEKDSDFYKAVKKLLKKNQGSLEERIESKFTASLRRVDLIRFHKELFENKEYAKAQVKNILTGVDSLFQDVRSNRYTKEDENTKKIVRKPLPKKTRKTLAFLVADQLSQYDLLIPLEEQKCLAKNKREDCKIENSSSIEYIKNKTLNDKNPFHRQVKAQLAFTETGLPWLFRDFEKNKKAIFEKFFIYRENYTIGDDSDYDNAIYNQIDQQIGGISMTEKVDQAFSLLHKAEKQKPEVRKSWEDIIVRYLTSHTFMRFHQTHINFSSELKRLCEKIMNKLPSTGSIPDYCDCEISKKIIPDHPPSYCGS